MTDTPLFDQTAAEHRDYLLGLLRTPVPPTCRQIIAAVDAAADGDTTEGDMPCKTV